MKAIIETGGFQFPVEQGGIVRVPKLAGDAGSKIDIDRVLLISGGDRFLLGKPYVEGAKVNAEIIGHGKGEKITVFKFKRRRKYRKTKGHRQDFTELKILAISV